MTVHLEPLDATKIAVQIETPKGDYRVVTESNHALDQTMTPWLPALVPVAMRHRWDLTFNGAVDSTALAGAGAAQDVIAGWWPKRYGTVPIVVESSSDHADGETEGVGSFFSGGVDSFYTAITQSDRVTHLVFVHGFDIKISDQTTADRALVAARTAAADLGKPLIEVKTTIRSSLGDRLKMPWGQLYHGPALAHVGLALAPQVGTALIPSTFSRDQLHPWGSHPDLDPLWSSGRVAIEHHELEVGRVDKIRVLGGSETAMNHLRVCWRNKNGSYNCGRCPKCIRTKLGLMVAGAESPALAGPIDPKAARRMVVTGGEREFMREALTAIRDAGRCDAELEKALRTAIRRSYFWQHIFS